MRRIRLRYPWLLGCSLGGLAMSSSACRCNDEPPYVASETGTETIASGTSDARPDLPADTSDSSSTDTSTETETDTETDTGETGPNTGCADGIVEPGELCFQRFNLVVDESCGAIALGDVHGDGLLDVIVGELDRAIVLPGTGDGFDAPIVLMTMDGVLGIAAGDLDGDQDDDVVASVAIADLVLVFASAGDGSFAAGQSHATGIGPRGLVIADLGDTAALDVALANESSGDVSVLFGDGSSALGPATDYPAGSVPLAVAAGDFDDDGQTDLVLVDVAGDTAVVLLQDAGTFPAPVAHGVGSEPRAVAVGDLDGDGVLDVVVANQGSDDVSVLLGDGVGGFWPEQVFMVGGTPRGLALGDFDGDELLDIAVANRADDRVGILVGQGDGSFAAQINLLTIPGPVALAAGDVDGDGVDDIVVASAGPAGGVTLLRSNH